MGCLLVSQGMDGMVKHPSTRKEQAYVIALGGASQLVLDFHGAGGPSAGWLGLSSKKKRADLP
jgi:hypothetical protein